MRRRCRNEAGPLRNTGILPTAKPCPRRSGVSASRSGLSLVALVGLVGLVANVVASPASASGYHAHWHYQIGARANAAKIFATQLYYEASAPGDLYAAPARANATDIARLSGEIVEWVDALQSVSSPREVALIADLVQEMRSTAESLGAQANEMVAWIDSADGTAATAATDAATDAAEAVATKAAAVGMSKESDARIEDPAVRGRIAERADVLFRGFGKILKAHKQAETALGIPVPEAPES